MCNYCIYQTRCIIFRTPWTAIHYSLAPIQQTLLILAWYTRLKLFISDSILRLSKSILYVFDVYFVISVIFCVLTMISICLYVTISIKYYNWFYLNTVIGSAWIALGLICLASLFFNKLRRAYKYLNNDPTFVSIITRFAILNIINLSLTFLLPIGGYLYGKNLHSVPHEFGYHFLIILDAFTNCLCTLLSFPYFNGVYGYFCGFVHKKCNNCWMNISQESQLAANIKMRSVDVTVTSTPQSRSPEPQQQIDDQQQMGDQNENTVTIVRMKSMSGTLEPERSVCGIIISKNNNEQMDDGDD